LLLNDLIIELNSCLVCDLHQTSIVYVDVVIRLWRR